MTLDSLDIKVMSLLASQGRMTWSELANQLGLSPPAAADRVKRLEDKGLIDGYSARLNAEGLGLDLAAFIAITLAHPNYRQGFLEVVQNNSAILECHHIAGDDDYLLKIRCRNTRHLEALISETLKSVEGVVKTRTSIVLSTVKETLTPPLEEI
jgi:Lrp/AsnC family leucine-responsive transcriptional regulator